MRVGSPALRSIESFVWTFEYWVVIIIVIGWSILPTSHLITSYPCGKATQKSSASQLIISYPCSKATQKGNAKKAMNLSGLDRTFPPH